MEPPPIIIISNKRLLLAIIVFVVILFNFVYSQNHYRPRYPRQFPPPPAPPAQPEPVFLAASPSVSSSVIIVPSSSSSSSAAPTFTTTTPLDSGHDSSTISGSGTGKFPDEKLCLDQTNSIPDGTNNETIKLNIATNCRIEILKQQQQQQQQNSPETKDQQQSEENNDQNSLLEQFFLRNNSQSLSELFGNFSSSSSSSTSNNNNNHHYHLLPHAFNVKTSPNGEITVINGKTVTSILYEQEYVQPAYHHPSNVVTTNNAAAQSSSAANEIRFDSIKASGSDSFVSHDSLPNEGSGNSATKPAASSSNNNEISLEKNPETNNNNNNNGDKATSTTKAPTIVIDGVKSSSYSSASSSSSNNQQKSKHHQNNSNNNNNNKIFKSTSFGAKISTDTPTSETSTREKYRIDYLRQRYNKKTSTTTTTTTEAPSTPIVAYLTTTKPLPLAVLKSTTTARHRNLIHNHRLKGGSTTTTTEAPSELTPTTTITTTTTTVSTRLHRPSSSQLKWRPYHHQPRTRTTTASPTTPTSTTTTTTPSPPLMADQQTPVRTTDPSQTAQIPEPYGLREGVRYSQPAPAVHPTPRYHHWETKQPEQYSNINDYYYDRNLSEIFDRKFRLIDDLYRKSNPTEAQNIPEPGQILNKLKNAAHHPHHYHQEQQTAPTVTFQQPQQQHYQLSGSGPGVLRVIPRNRHRIPSPPPTPTPTPPPEVFVTIENKYIVLRNNSATVVQQPIQIPADSDPETKPPPPPPPPAAPPSPQPIVYVRRPRPPINPPITDEYPESLMHFVQKYNPPSQLRHYTPVQHQQKQSPAIITVGKGQPSIQMTRPTQSDRQIVIGPGSSYGGYVPPASSMIPLAASDAEDQNRNPYTLVRHYINTYLPEKPEIGGANAVPPEGPPKSPQSRIVFWPLTPATTLSFKTISGQSGTRTSMGVAPSSPMVTSTKQLMMTDTNKFNQQNHHHHHRRPVFGQETPQPPVVSMIPANRRPITEHRQPSLIHHHQRYFGMPKSATTVRQPITTPMPPALHSESFRGRHHHHHHHPEPLLPLFAVDPYVAGGGNSIAEDVEIESKIRKTPRVRSPATSTASAVKILRPLMFPHDRYVYRNPPDGFLDAGSAADESIGVPTEHATNELGTGIRPASASSDPFAEYYSDRILPMNSMMDYPLLWKAALANTDNPMAANQLAEMIPLLASEDGTSALLPVMISANTTGTEKKNTTTTDNETGGNALNRARARLAELLSLSNILNVISANRTSTSSSPSAASVSPVSGANTEQLAKFAEQLRQALTAAGAVGDSPARTTFSESSGNGNNGNNSNNKVFIHKIGQEIQMGPPLPLELLFPDESSPPPVAIPNGKRTTTTLRPITASSMRLFLKALNLLLLNNHHHSP